MKNKKIISLLVFAILFSSFVHAEKYFVLDVNHLIGSVTFNSISLRELDRKIDYDKEGFLVKTVSFGNSDIKTAYYNMTENKNYVIYMPYDKNAARMEIYSKNSKIMDIDVASFSDTCGSRKCEPHESYESCPIDCASGSRDDFCDGVKDNICDPDCSSNTDIDCEEEKIEEANKTNITKTDEKQLQQGFEEEPKEKSNYLMWILLVLGIIILILLILFVKKKKENQTIDSLRQYISENVRRGFTMQQIKEVLYREGYTEKEVNKAIKSI